jgi:hypothetical protein
MLLIDGRRCSSLFNEFDCFLRVRHVGHVAGIYLNRLGMGRFAIIRSWSGLIDRSAVATMYQVGLVFQAGDVTLWVNESVEIGACDWAMKWDTAGGTSAAKSAAK